MRNVSDTPTQQHKPRVNQTVHHIAPMAIATGTFQVQGLGFDLSRVSFYTDRTLLFFLGVLQVGLQ